MLSTNRVLLLLGSNINPETNVAAAISQLRARYRIIELGQLWHIPAVGSCAGQADFINQGLVIECGVGLAELKSDVKSIERRIGRAPGSKNAPRCIDIDVIHFDGRVVDASLFQYDFMRTILAELQEYHPWLAELP